MVPLLSNIHRQPHKNHRRTRRPAHECRRHIDMQERIKFKRDELGNVPRLLRYQPLKESFLPVFIVSLSERFCK